MKKEASVDTVLEKSFEEVVAEIVHSEDLPNYFLETSSGPEDGCIFPITKETTTIGRFDSNDVVVAYDRLASREHAKIIQEQDVFYISDHSRHGTEVDGTRIYHKTSLVDGSMILIGETMFCFRLGRQSD